MFTPENTLLPSNSSGVFYYVPTKGAEYNYTMENGGKGGDVVERLNVMVNK